jgi:MFS transporter, FHS family, Na+ dependent glucose transporter 1
MKEITQSSMPVSPQASSSAETLRILRTVGYFASFVTLGLMSASLGPSLPQFAANTHSELSQVSFLFSARSLGYLVGSWLGGRLYDRVRGNRLMGVLLIVMLASLAITPVVARLWLLTALLFVLGAGEGAVDVGGNILMMWTHGDKVAPFMNGLHFFYGLGAFLSPIIVAQVMLHTGGIQWAYWILALIALPVAIYQLSVPGPRHAKASVDGLHSGKTNYALVAWLGIVFVMYVGAEVSFGGWIYTYGLSMGMEKTLAAYLTSTFWGALTLGRLLSVPFAARVKPRILIMADFIGCLASISLLIILNKSQAILWVGAFGAGLFMASIFPTMLTFAGQVVHINGQVTGLFLVASSIGSMVFPWLIGQLFNKVGESATMYVIGTILAIGLLVFTTLIIYLNQGKRKTIEAG